MTIGELKAILDRIGMEIGPDVPIQPTVTVEVYGDHVAITEYTKVDSQGGN